MLTKSTLFPLQNLIALKRSKVNVFKWHVLVSTFYAVVGHQHFAIPFHLTMPVINFESALIVADDTVRVGL
mgnify:CR=1